MKLDYCSESPCSIDRVENLAGGLLEYQGWPDDGDIDCVQISRSLDVGEQLP